MRLCGYDVQSVSYSSHGAESWLAALMPCLWACVLLISSPAPVENDDGQQNKHKDSQQPSWLHPLFANSLPAAQTIASSVQARCFSFLGFGCSGSEGL